MMLSRRALLFNAAMLPLAACEANGQENLGIDTEANEARYAGSPWRRLTEAQWRERLEPLAFRVLRQEATERAFTSPLNDERRSGTFVCAGCDLPLFHSRWKFNSGTGWPSFTDIIRENAATKLDFLLLQARTEYHCGATPASRASARTRG